MGIPRSRTVDPTVCGIFHCISRCVRRHFLLGDVVRAVWIAQRLEFLASIFAIDVIEYAILTNHIHLILGTRPDLAWCWTDEEVAERWLLLRAAGPMGIGVEPAARPSPEAIRAAAADEAAVDDWRRRLADLGWFHKELKEPCAKAWNELDGVTGHFWLGRYTAKVALDDAALVSQALYVLLNLVRAGTESAIGESELTSMGRRMKRIIAEIRAGGHAKALATFESRVVNGQWTAAFPCRPGSVAELSDEAYAERVARGRHRASIRHAVRKEAETIGRLATDATADELETMLADEPALGQAIERRAEAASPHVSRQRLRPRQSSLPAADLRPSESSWRTAMENPFATSRVGSGPRPILPGLTLATLIRLADAAGRQARPDKSGRISAESRSALDAFRARALADEDRAPDGAIAASRQIDLQSSSWVSELAAGVRATANAAMATLARHGELLASIVEAKERNGTTPAQAADAEPGPSARPPAPHPPSEVGAEGAAPRVRWFGSVVGGESSRGAEARRRASRHVVDVRPTAA